MYESDAWGRPRRIVRTVEREETEWDDEQRDFMLALAELEANECPGCGGWLPETTSPDADRNNRTGSHYYGVGAPTRCHRCTALSMARTKHTEAAKKAGGGQHDHALFFAAERLERPRRGGT